MNLLDSMIFNMKDIHLICPRVYFTEKLLKKGYVDLNMEKPTSVFYTDELGA